MNMALSQIEPNLPLAMGYTQAIRAVPILSAEEEYDLALKFKKQNDVQAVERLVLSHLRFVIYIARDYRNYGIAMADLVQEGAIGLMKAVSHFDPERGVRLISYAVYWIRSEIYEFILRNWRIVKVVTTKAQRKLFFNLHKMKKRLNWFNGEQIEDVAQALGVKPKDVTDMEIRLVARDQLYDPWSHSEEGDQSRRQPQGYLADLRFEPSTQLEHKESTAMTHQALQKALRTLDARAQDIIQHRWLTENRSTLGELAETYGISKERIRQIEVATLLKLKKQLAPMVHLIPPALNCKTNKQLIVGHLTLST